MSSTEHQSSGPLLLLRDLSLTVAAAVTVVGTILWLQEERRHWAMREATLTAQRRLCEALDRLAGTLDRLETRLASFAVSGGPIAEQGGDASGNAESNGTATPRRAPRRRAAAKGTGVLPYAEPAAEGASAGRAGKTARTGRQPGDQAPGIETPEGNHSSGAGPARSGGDAE